MTAHDLPPAMIAAARRAMEAALQLTDRDRVLVLGDETVGRCAEAFAAAAAEVGCVVTRHALPEAGRPHTSLPAGLAELLDGVTVVVNALDGRSDEVPFRIVWIKAIEETGRIRLGHCPGITEDMMTGGCLDVDYGAMQERERRLREGLAGAERLRITAPAGTALELSVAGRPFVSDLLATVATGVNLPCGEIYCAPVEDGADGVLVVDGPVGGDGIPPAPLSLTVVGGRVTDVACDDAAWQATVEGYMAADSQANVICELGIGLNPAARLAGRMLEDEKALRTCHVAFGSNEGMPGGRSVSCMHIDYLVHRPTIEVLEAGRARPLLRDGDLIP
jgi:leucyl aminopeptidase (aminopeptidase T)